MKKIAIFAGTFDPIHNGHLAFADAVLKTGIEKVWFLVEPRPRHKQGVKALQHRQAMVDLAIADNPRLGSIVIDQPRFTVSETLPILQARFKGFGISLMFGNDVVAHMTGWPHVSELFKSVELLVATRKNNQSNPLHSLKYFEKARGLKVGYKAIESENSQISSSTIRQTIKRGKKTKDLPPKVLKYIQKNQIYSSSSSS